MSERPAEFKLRMPASLRARLEAEGDAHGLSLNSVIINHLTQAARDADLGRVVFGSEEQFRLLAALDRLILSIQLKTGKGIEDRDTRHGIADQISGFFKNILEIFPAYASRPLLPYEVQALADGTALAALAALRGTPIVFPSDPAAAEAAAAEAAVAAEAFVKRFPDHPFSRQFADAREAPSSDEAAAKAAE